MTSPTYNTTFELNERTLLYWGQEKSAAGTVAASLFKEEFGTFSWSPQRTIWVNNFRTGFPSTRQGTQATVQHATVTINVPFHPGGLGGYAWATMHGDVSNTGASDTITGGADPYTHTVVPGVNSTRIVPFSFVFVSLMDSSGTPGLQFTYGTLTSVKLSGTSGNPVMAEIQATCFYPTAVAQPSGTWSTPNTYTFGYQSNHVIYNSAGSQYSAQILDGDVTISRPANVIPSYNNNSSQNPIDIVPGDLSLQANMTLYYDGLASGKAYTDYLNYLKSGSASHINKMVWTDANSPAHSFEVDFWPAAWATSNMQTGDGVMTCQATLDAEQDFSSATQGSPAWTLVKQSVLKNSISTAMIV